MRSNVYFPYFKQVCDTSFVLVTCVCLFSVNTQADSNNINFQSNFDVEQIGNNERSNVDNGYDKNGIFYQNSSPADGYINDGTNWYMFKKGIKMSEIQPWMGGFYYFDPTSYLRVDNVFRDEWGKTYYFGSNGQAVSGLKDIGKGTYYFGDDQTYFLRRSCWIHINGSTYYAGQDGQLLSGIQKIDGTYYFFDLKNHQMHTNSYDMGYPDCWYMFGSDGKIVTGLYLYLGNYYYFDPSTFLRVDNRDISIGGHVWHFDYNGVGSQQGLSFESAKQGGINGFWGNGAAIYHTYYTKQCTSFVAGVLAAANVPANEYEHLGNGYQWADSARAKGIKVNMTPTPGAVVCFAPAGWNGNAGHVAYITSINSNGTFHIIEGNWSGRDFHERDINLDGSISGIIHF